MQLRAVPRYFAEAAAEAGLRGSIEVTWMPTWQGWYYALRLYGGEPETPLHSAGGRIRGDPEAGAMLRAVFDDAIRLAVEKRDKTAPEAVGIDATAEAVAAPAETPPWLRYREEFGRK